ncbi:MAG: hypothetical protein ACRDLP_02510 [Solirubrobacteraceae bacterium]
MSRSISWTAALLGLAILVGGCGGAHDPTGAGSGSNRASVALLAYARCMRGHGVSDFPDPSAAGRIAISGRGDLNPGAPTFRAASRACRGSLRGGNQGSTPSAQKIASEVRWAHCLRAHGVPDFPDPNSQGAIDSGRFDPDAPAFARAGRDCLPLRPSGAITAVPGRRQ